MPTVADLKRLYPNLADYADHEVVDIYAQNYGLDRNSAAASLGVQINEPGFGATMNRTAGQMAGGVGEIVGDVTGERDNAVSRYADEVLYRNPSGINSLQDVVDNPWLALKEATANAATMITPAVGLRAAGAGLQVLGAKRKLDAVSALGRAANSLGVQTIPAALPSIGEIGEKQRASGREDLPMKYVGGVGVGAIETLGGVQRGLGIGRSAPGTFARGQTPLRTVGRVLGRTAVEEGLEEVIQTPIEQITGFQDPTTAQSLHETALGGVMGTLGGAIGLPTAIQQGMRHSDDAAKSLALRRAMERRQEVDLLRQNTARPTEQMALDLGGPQQQQMDLLGGLGRVPVEQAAAQGWQRDDAQAAAIRAQYAREGLSPDQIAAEEARSEQLAQEKAKRENELIYGPTVEEAPSTRATAQGALDLGQMQQTELPLVGGAPSVRAPVIEALTRLAPKTALKKDGTLRKQVEKALQQYQNFSDNEIAQSLTAFADGKSAPWRTVMLEAIARERQRTAASPVAPSPAPAPAVDGGGNRAGGVEPGAGPSVVPVDAPRQPVPAEPGADLGSAASGPVVLGADAAQAPLETELPAVDTSAFPPVQRRVIEHVQRAVRESRADEVIDKDGVLMYENIGKALGIKRGSVKTAVNGALKNYARSVGLSAEQVKAQLARSRRSLVEEDGPIWRAPDEMRQGTGVDERELGPDGELSVIDSMGHSVGATFEDEGATAAAAEEPNPVLERRQAEARAERDAYVKAVLAHPIAGQAQQDWDESRSEGAADFAQLDEATRVEWVEVYAALMSEEISLDEANAAQRRIEKEAAAGAGVVEGGAGQTQSGQPADARSADEGVRREDDRQDEATGESVQANPLEQRVDRLRELGGEGQAKRLDKLINRFRDGDIDTARFADELETMERQAFPPDSGGKGIQYSRGEGSGSSVRRVLDAIAPLFISPAQFARKVTVVQSADELTQIPEVSSVDVDGTAQGFVSKGRAYLIAGNIAEGSELAVFLHEVGVHLGLRGMIGSKNMDALATQIDKWAAQPGESTEAQVARRALERVGTAEQTDDLDAAGRAEEAIAYFVEEAVSAGINPMKATGATASWFRKFWAAVKVALRKFGFNRLDKLTAQDVVSLAHGAAKLELEGTYHGTAADFRRFDHRFMNIVRPVTYKGADRERVKFSRAASITEHVVDNIPAQARPAVKFAATTVREAVRSGGNLLKFTEDLVRGAADLLPTAKQWYAELGRREQVHMHHKAKIDDLGNRVDRLGREEFLRTWTLVRDMTSKQLWAYQPTWRGTVTINPELEARYTTLEPIEKTLIDDLFRHGHETQAEVRKVLDDLVAAEYADALALAKTPAQIKKVNERFSEHRTLFGLKAPELDGPYAPMRRVGSHVMVARSQAFLDATKPKDIARMRQDEKHYIVEFHDSLAQAEKRRDELAGDYATAEATVREVYTQQNVLPFAAFDRLRHAIEGSVDKESGKDDTTVRKLSTLVNELYLTSLAETSARKSSLRRHNDAGMDADSMYRAFVSKGQSDAYYLGALKNGRTVAQAYAKMRAEANAAGPKRHERRSVFNELATRYDASLQFDDSPLVGKLLNFSSMWMLLTKPAYFFYNATQPLMLTQPALAAKHGYKRSMDAMWASYRELAGLKAFSTLAAFDIKQLPADVREAVSELRDRGRIDITITQDLGARIHGARTAGGRAMQSVERSLKAMAQKVEMTNRVVTAVAAYRLSREKGSTHEQAIDYAEQLIYDTHGDYSNTNAPRAFNANGALRVMTQFRKFQFIQVAQLWRMGQQAMEGKTAHEKWIMSRALRYTLGHHALLAGSMGLPAANVISMFFALTGGEDEPRDLETSLRKAIGDPFMADLLLRGLPTIFDADISNNVGMGQTFSILPFADTGFGDRGGYEKVVTAATGPLFGGFGLQAWNAMGALKNGDYYKGLEGLLPSGVRAAARAFREGVSGVQNTRGDTLIEPEEIAVWATLLKTMGFRTQSDGVRHLTRRTSYNFEEFFDNRTAQIKGEYVTAIEENDAPEAARLRQEFMALQQVKREAGFKGSAMSTLLKAPGEKRERERNVVRGVPFDSGNERFVRTTQ